MSYGPIKDYGLVGDGFGAALISKKAAVDWLTVRRFDSDPLCWRILDDEKGGSLQVKLTGEWSWSRGYLEKTNILVTRASRENSQVKFTDFMPVGRVPGSKTHDYTRLHALHALVRIIEVEGDPVEIEISHSGEGWPQSSKICHLYSGSDQLAKKDEQTFTVHVSPEEPLYLVLAGDELSHLHAELLKELFEISSSFWKEWVDYSQYRGPHQDLINRSALVLKMLIYADSGAIIAAPTTSLPEEIGGERNWDYRYCWLRDATFTLYALGYLGYSGEAIAFGEYLKNVLQENPGELQILYALDGKAKVPEKIFEDIKGYKGSSPVRTGNGAYDQSQLDALGDFIDGAYLHRELGGELDEVLMENIEATAQRVARIWSEKDHGIWEIRGEPEDFTFSKIMCWVALDRAERLLGHKDLYREEKKSIENFVKTKCTHNKRLKRSAQNMGLDASLLLALPMGFPVDEEVYENTLSTIQKDLSRGIFVKRYNGGDGLSGEEGEFIICSFWLVNALLFTGRIDEAKALFEKLMGCFNDLGLLSEEIDAQTGDLLGNFPQALSHLAFIETSSYFELYKEGGLDSLKGCHGDRARRMHKTLHGPQAVWNFVKNTGRIDKILPSHKSILKAETLRQ